MKRKLKKYAENQVAKYRNEEFLEELKAMQSKKKKDYISKKGIVSLIVSLSVTIVTLTVVLLCVFLIRPKDYNVNVTPQSLTQTESANDNPIKEIVPEKVYLGENLKSYDSDLEELNNALYYISFALVDSIKVYVDEEYNETLYYDVTYNSEDGLSSFEFQICDNPDYKMDELSKEYEKKSVVASHEIQYHETVNCEDDIYFFTESAKIATDREIILIDAEIIGFEENSNFIEILNEIIQAK